MKISIVFSTISIVFFLLISPVYATEKDILIVTNGNTETHRDVFDFIKKTFRQLHAPYRLSRLSHPERVSNISADAIVMININTSSGIDPVLEKFIDAVSSKKKVVLVNLYQGRNELTIVHTKPQEHPLHIDALTAASMWDSPGFFGQGTPDEKSIRKMHKNWVIKLMELLEKH